MDSNLLADLSGAQMARLIASKELSPVELVNAYIDRIDKLNPKVNAFVTVCQEEAIADARLAEEAVMRGDALQPSTACPSALKTSSTPKTSSPPPVPAASPPTSRRKTPPSSPEPRRQGQC